MEVLVRTISQEKEIKGFQIGKEELKLSFVEDDIILNTENPKDSTKKLSKLSNEFNKVVEYKISMHIWSLFLCMVLKNVLVSFFYM